MQSTKPEVHNVPVLHRSQRRIEPRPQTTYTGSLVVWWWTCGFRDMQTDRQTDRQTQKLITIFRSRPGAEQ